MKFVVYVLRAAGWLAGWLLDAHVLEPTLRERRNFVRNDHVSIPNSKAAVPGDGHIATPHHPGVNTGLERTPRSVERVQTGVYLNTASSMTSSASTVLALVLLLVLMDRIPPSLPCDRGRRTAPPSYTNRVDCTGHHLLLPPSSHASSEVPWVDTRLHRHPGGRNGRGMYIHTARCWMGSCTRGGYILRGFSSCVPRCDITV